MKAKVIKVGNSYALRLPIQYIRENQLEEGSEIQLPDIAGKGNLAEVMREFAKHPSKLSDLGIDDPVEWQRQQRDWGEPWEEVQRKGF